MNRITALIVPAALFACVFPCAPALSANGAPASQSQITNHKSQITERLDRSITSAARYLVRKQSADGAWRSETYGCFKDGPSLTGLVMSAMFFMPPSTGSGWGPAVMKQSYKRGAGYLVRMVAPEGSIRAGKYGLNFPVLSAASASRVVVLLERTPENLAAQQAWLRFLRGYQLNAALGWSPSDPEFGGWGFSLKPPRKPKPGELREDFAESNMVATIFAIGALRSAKTPADDPVWKDVLAFVQRCQNYPDTSNTKPVILSEAKNPSSEKQILRDAQNDTSGEKQIPRDARNDRVGDARFDDGGFFFIPTDPLQNKAGIAGKDSRGRTRFHSYGSMTADGLRALIRCGLPPDHPRVVAARKWLEAHFSVEHVPGVYEPDRKVLRDATYYYWCWSVAHALGEMGTGSASGPKATAKHSESAGCASGPKATAKHSESAGYASGPEATTKHSQYSRWAEALAEELIKRQRPDGSWANRFTDAKEDDPLVATSWAAAVLAICREALTGEIRELVPRRGKPRQVTTPTAYLGDASGSRMNRMSSTRSAPSSSFRYATTAQASSTTVICESLRPSGGSPVPRRVSSQNTS